LRYPLIFYVPTAGIYTKWPASRYPAVGSL